MRPSIFIRSFVTPTLLIGFAFSVSGIAVGQDSPKAAYEHLVKANKEKNWEKIFSVMTKKAGDQVFDQMIQMAYQFKSSPVPLPNAGDLKPEIEKLFEEYKINEFKYPQPDFFGGGIPDKAAIEEYQKKSREAAREIAKKIGMRKFDFVRRLNKVMSKSPFGNVSGMMFNAKIEDIEEDGNGATATLKIDPKDLGIGGGGGPDIKIEIPPIPVKFVKENNKWKFDGVDEKKAMEQLEKNAQDIPEVDFDF